MHDVLRDMGRDFVKEEAQGSSKWTHLCDPSTAAKVLGYKKTNSSTRAMSFAVRAGNQKIIPLSPRMGKPKGGAVFCDASQLASMKELHFLILDGCDVIVHHGFSSWPRELRWLQWRQCCFASLPSHLNLPNLVVLDLSNSDMLTRLWENDADVQLPLLQKLDLSSCGSLEEFAENVDNSVPTLKTLVMSGCFKLRRLPDSIGHMTCLEHLDLMWCKGLGSLPDAFVGLLSLRTLMLRFCSKLQQLPEELGKLTNLEALDVSWCNTLSNLPASVGELRMLKTLDMDVTGVKDLPMEFGLLTSLTSLSMEGLCSVPETFQGLQAFTSLSVVEGSKGLGSPC